MNNMKCLMTVSIVALMTASAAQAADIKVPQEIGETIVVAPAFSWTGFYFGGQIGGFSGEATFKNLNDLYRDENDFWEQKSLKLSSFIGGIYGGSNINVGENLILGVDTDMMWSGKKNTQVLSLSNLNTEFRTIRGDVFQS
ncbi:MAG: hemin-binding protein E, partial [Bartonella sp.]|nr:hemin-binding protein E [Bartonella sp.]